nr:oligopeptide transporter 4-like [Ipomoea batatas]
MGTVEIEAPALKLAGEDVKDDEVSPIEEVRLTVPNTDDPTLPVWTFRMWVLGLVSCVLLSFLNQFFSYRREPLIITSITVQVATLPIGRFMAAALPAAKFRVPGFGPRQFSLNPGAFNMKEHVLITIFANAGFAFGNGSAYAVGIVNIIIAFYRRKISFFAGWILIITTQVLGYGWAGLLRKYVVEPAHMWWPSTLVQISLFRIHLPNSVKHFMGMLGISEFRDGPPAWFGPERAGPRSSNVGLVHNRLLLVQPSRLSVLRNRQRFCGICGANGQGYDISAIVNKEFELDIDQYGKQGRISLSTFFSLSYGFGFATIASTITHVALFYGREIYDRYQASSKGKMDIHTKLMKNYKDIPTWWFYLLLVVTIVVSLALCIFLKDEVQMPYWGLIFAAALAFMFTLPISIITATTNQTPGLNIITEYIMGVIYPGKPIANVCFKTYGYMSMTQAIAFLSDFKLGHYMKIPPRSMFLVQFIGTMIAGTVNMGVAWWLLHSVDNICHQDKLSNSPWTCPSDRVFFDASVIWGLVGPKRIFGNEGNYRALNWFFLGGILGPIIVWLLHNKFPSQSWIPLINLPVLLGATASMPPATALNYTSWILVGTIFNFFVFRYRKKWWQRYNYILSAALDAGVAFMAVLLYFTVGLENKSVSWWGTNDPEHCDLATCPTAKGIAVDGCPVF